MIPIGNELRAAIDAMPADRLTFITTARGEPFTAAGFTNWFRDRCREAGLPIGLSAHGLAQGDVPAARRGRLLGKEIAAISGHKTLRMMQRYTEAADQERYGKGCDRTARERKCYTPGAPDLHTAA